MKQGYLILETSTILADHTKGHLCLKGFIKYSLSPQKKIFLSMDRSCHPYIDSRLIGVVNRALHHLQVNQFILINVISSIKTWGNWSWVTKLAVKWFGPECDRKYVHTMLSFHRTTAVLPTTSHFTVLWAVLLVLGQQRPRQFVQKITSALRHTINQMLRVLRCRPGRC